MPSASENTAQLRGQHRELVVDQEQPREPSQESELGRDGGEAVVAKVQAVQRGEQPERLPGLGFRV